MRKFVLIPRKCFTGGPDGDPAWIRTQWLRQRRRCSYLEACERKGQPLSDSEVARRLGISRRTVERARADSEELSRLARPRMVTRSGSSYFMAPRRPTLPAPDDLDDDPTIAGIFGNTPAASAPTSPPERPSPQQRPSAPRDRPAPSRPAAPAAGTETTVRLIVSWAYADAQGAQAAGSTDLEHLDELPPAVRARLLQGLKDDG